MKGNSNYIKVLLVAGLLSMISKTSFAETAVAVAPSAPEKLSIWTNGGGILMVCTIILLACIILVLGRILKTMIHEDTVEEYRTKKSGKGLVALLILMMLSISSQAQEAVATVPTGPATVFGMEAIVFWIMAGVLIFEFIVLLVLCYVLYSFLVRKGLIKVATKSTLPSWLNWNKLMGNDTPMEKEADLTFDDHDFDGIQELDNGMPPMLKYIFIATIVAAVYYWIDYHVLKTSPLQIAEYEMELKEGELQKAEYLKNAGASVDENTVTLLTDANALESGAKIYATNCIACHGDKGQGGVGPNLTDKYWLHGGDIKSVFKSIKYGIPDKGMRAWESEIKPADIQALSSYIEKTFANTNVAGGKAPQGEEFKSSGADVVKDSTSSTSIVDTTKVK